MKLTKTFALVALVAGNLLAGNTALQAQDNTNTPPAGTPPGGSGMRGRPNFEAISKQLELTDDQKPKVKAVLEDLQKQSRELRQDTSLSQEDRHAKMKEIRDGASAKLKDILTADQFAKWQKIGQRQRPVATPPQQ